MAELSDSLAALMPDRPRILPSSTGTATTKDPNALSVVRGRVRKLEPRVNPESRADMVRWNARREHPKRPVCVSLWSGAGGLDLGLQRAGYDVLVAADRDEWACQTNSFNSAARVFCRDLDDPDETRHWLRGLELPEVALVAGGFPCQPYSRAGTSIIRHLVETAGRPEIDTRAFAWQTFVGAVAELQPARALAENVPDLARFDDGQQLRDIVRALENEDYEVDVRVLPARLFGVPQYRERLFVQAARETASIRWPKPPSGEAPSVRSAIFDLPTVAAGAQTDPVPYEPRATPPRWARDGVSPNTEHYLFDHICREVRPDDLQAFEQLSPGGTYLDIPAELRRYDDQSFTDKYKRLEWDLPSRTITAHIARDGYWYIHPEVHRTLSVREAARIQTFPDWFRFAGFPSNRFTQIGNAVPPLLGCAIGEALLLASEASESSAVPRAAALLRATADEYWNPMDAWQLLVREVVFSGRANDKRIGEFIARFPALEDAAKIRSPKLEHERRAATLARRLLKQGETLPNDTSRAQRLTGGPEAGARLIVALAHGGRPPQSESTLRVAERVSGVHRAGSLNGISHVTLARLSDFGADVRANQLLLDLGRNVCLAESPLCGECPLAEACSYRQAHAGVTAANVGAQ